MITPTKVAKSVFSYGPLTQPHIVELGASSLNDGSTKRMNTTARSRWWFETVFFFIKPYTLGFHDTI